LPAGTTSYINEGVRPGATYKFRVRAIHPDGTATFSDDSGSVITPADGISPTAPTNLVASNVSETQATLTWDPAFDNDLIYKYEVYTGSTLVATLTGGPEGNPLPATTTLVTG